MAGNKTTILSQSRVSCFMSCRRKYWFRYVLGLEPIGRSLPLSFGGAVHKGLEVLFSCGDMAAVEKAIMDSYTKDELAEAGPWPRVALEAIKAFDASGWRTRFEVREPERHFEISIGHGRRVHGYFDGIVRGIPSGGTYILEIKTSNPSPGYLHHLLWDMQSGVYTMAAQQIGIPAMGMYYLFLPRPSIKPYKATPELERKYTKAGTLYANQRDRDETDDEFVERCRQWYAENPNMIVSHIVVRNENQMEEMKRQLLMLVADLRTAERDCSWYMNPGACSVLGCEFSGVCLEDTPEARTLFRSRDDRDEGKETQKIGL